MSALEIDVVAQEIMQPVLDILGIYNDCDAFFMAFRLQRLGNHSKLFVHKGKEDIAYALQKVSDLLRPLDPRDNTYYLDEVWPLDDGSHGCDTHPSEGFGQKSGPDSVIQGAGKCSDHSAGFPPNTKILRYLTINNNVGLSLNHECSQDGVGMCVSNSTC